MPRDEMTPRERMTAFARGEQIDRLPCLPLISDHASRLIGETVSRCSRSAKLMVEAQLAAFRRYRPENVIALMDAARLYGRIPIDPSKLE